MEDNTENKSLELDIVREGLNGYQLRGYAGLQCQVADLIEKNTLIKKVECERDISVIKSERTTLRKAKAVISDYRIQATKLIIGQFAEQCSSLEKLLDSADRELKEELDRVKNETVENMPRPRIYTVTVSTLSEESAKKVADYARKLKCEVIQNGGK